MFKRRETAVNQIIGFWLTKARAVGWWLMPARCLLCESPGLATDVDLCAHCAAALPASEIVWRPGREPIDAVFSPWSYAYPIDQMVRQLKFHGDRSVARALATLLARAREPLAPLPELLVPVPLHRTRLLERGYNQAAEIAQFAARTLRLECAPRALTRTRQTREQSHLRFGERLHNPTGAFAAASSVSGRSVALIDDVMTTGSTLRAAAVALQAAGATRIEVWVLARAKLKFTGIGNSAN